MTSIRSARIAALTGIAVAALAAATPVAQAKMSHLPRPIQAAPRPVAPPPVVRPPVAPSPRIGVRPTAPRHVVLPRLPVRPPAAPVAAAIREEAASDRRDDRSGAPRQAARLPAAAHVARHRDLADLSNAPLPPHRPDFLVAAATLPPLRPADLDRIVAETDAARGAAEARDAAEAALAGHAVTPFDFAGLGDPSRPAGDATGEPAGAARARDLMGGLGGIYGGGGGVDALGSITGLGLPSNREGRSEPSGLRLDPTRLPGADLAAQDGDSEPKMTFTTFEQDGDTERATTRDPETGETTVTESTQDESGSYQVVRTYDANGDQVDETYRVSTPSGHVRLGIRTPAGHSWSDRYRDGRTSEGSEAEPGFTRPRLDRLMTGEETTGGWCGPSGWGCSLTTVREALAGAGTHVDPGDGGAPAGEGPRLVLDEETIAGNPDIHGMGGGGGGRSARSFDGGRLVNPGDPD